MKGICCVLFVLILGMFASTQERPVSSASPKAIDAESFRLHLLSILDAHQHNDLRTVEILVNALKLDNPEQWFAQTFDSEHAKALVPAYTRSFDAFRSRLMKKVEWADNAKANISVEQHLRPTEGVSPSPSASIPTTDVAIHSFKCVLAAEGKGRNEWVDSYVMVGGRLQFIGGGAFPFWSAPLSIKTKKPH